MATRTIELPDELNRFVNEQVGQVGYATADDVVQAGLRLLEAASQTRQRELKALVALGTTGFQELDAGLGIVFDGDGAIDEFMGRVDARIDRDEGLVSP
jgi:putative addiction module CopG family antidote